MRVITVLTAAIAAIAAPAPALAQEPGTPVTPIPNDPTASGVPDFVGSPTQAHPAQPLFVPQNPFMAPNGKSNLHDDAYQSDTYKGVGPLGQSTSSDSALFFRECASVTFDSRGRLVAVCVGLDKPVLAMLDPKTLEPLAEMDLPPRAVSTNPFQDFSGGGYFYLDDHDRAVISAANRHILVVAETGGASDPGFAVRHDYDLTGAVPQGDSLISALPDWGGRIWFASKGGVVGIVDRSSGKIASIDTKEPIGNSFAVGDDGGVYIVTDKALYRFGAGRKDRPRVVWRRVYPNIGVVKPGQTEKGSGTTPTLMGKRYVAITDNADPMDVLVYKRQANVAGGRLVCKHPVFRKGQSDTDQSLIATRRSLIAENNYGYTGPAATMNGGVTSPGIERVDLNRGGQGCHKVWLSDERAPSVVPKLALGAGLVYTYTKPPRADNADAWYFTALRYRTGKTVYQRLAGTGFGYNNNYAPVTIPPNGTAYVGVLGGITRFEDTAP